MLLKSKPTSRWYITGNKLKMKKSLAILIFAGVLTICCNAQNIIQISNDGNRNSNNYNQQQDCEFRINGIGATEDIGGVDFEEKRNSEGAKDVLATNYNSFTVTVLFKIEYGRSSSYGIEREAIVTKVLRPNESKWLGIDKLGRRPFAWGYHLTYSITRKLGN
mgnify:CR=1 FL=1